MKSRDLEYVLNQIDEDLSEDMMVGYKAGALDVANRKDRQHQKAMDEAMEIINSLVWDMRTTGGVSDGFTADEEVHMTQALAFLAKHKE